MSQFLNGALRRLTPYTPGEQPRNQAYIKLNTNESPYPPSPGVLAALNRAEGENLRLYSDPEAVELREALAARYGVERENVFVANGSDEALSFAFLAYAADGRGVAFPDISYGFYAVFARLYGIPVRQVPLRADFRLVPEDYNHLHRTIVLANPNAPTGLALSRDEVEGIVRANPDAVVVVDEAGRYAVPILSGHLGGANDLARRIAGLTGAEAVLTTATDVNGVFAADQWARRQGLLVPWPERILGVSSRLLAGETVPLWSRCPVSGPCPAGLIWGERDRADIVVDWTPPRPEALWLCPRTLRVGVGCRRGTSEEAIRALFDRTLDGLGLPARAVGAVCSIDLKAEEPGLLAFAGALGLPLTVYSAGRLARVEGSVSPSSFVAQVTGVDNVCERAALAEGGVLLKSKTALDGVTLALAGTEPNLDWRERV